MTEQKNSVTVGEISVFVHRLCRVVQGDDLMWCVLFVFQVCDVVDRVLKHPIGGPLMKDLHPEFVPPTRPFMRMAYADAIKYLKEHNITKEDGTFYEFGEVGRGTLFLPRLNTS